MKKFLYIMLIIFLFLSGCNKSSNNPDEEVSFDSIPNDEKVLIMINQAIDDYNNNLINEKEKEWNTTISPLPIEIDSIPNINSLKELKDIKIKNRITNAVFDGLYELGDYSMIFEIFNYGTSYWLNGVTSFIVDLDTIELNNPDYKEIKNTLDSLMSEDIEVLAWLYGVNVDLGAESNEYPGFYKVISIGPYKYKSIQDLKDKAETIFTTDFLATYYQVAFENEDPIYKEIEGELYCSISESDIYDGLPYDTSRIIATKETENEILIDLVVSFGEDVDSTVQRIVLIKTENGLRFNNVY
ncbi:MAG: hypothetical protein GX368_05270 [Erysipelotrichaceae bacterium]|nr:hypothetical protein [Erysipelotrichaceae bacterium]